MTEWNLSQASGEYHWENEEWRFLVARFPNLVQGVETMASTNFSAEQIRQVADELGLYVYALVDRETGEPFYVGKGRRDRFAQHGIEAHWALEKFADNADDESQESLKVEENAKYERLRRMNYEPEIWILRYGLREGEYTAVEAACIDLLQSFPIQKRSDGEKQRIPNGYKDRLTNLRREKAQGHGIVRLDDLLIEKNAPILTYGGNLLIITLGDWEPESDETSAIPGGKTRSGFGFKQEWLASEERVKHYKEIGDAACAWWRLSERTISKKNIEYIVAVYRGVTRGLFKIVEDSWETITYTYVNEQGETKQGKRIGCQYEIVDSGELFDELVGQYGHRLPTRPKQNQHYWPFT